MKLLQILFPQFVAERRRNIIVRFQRRPMGFENQSWRWNHTLGSEGNPGTGSTTYEISVGWNLGIMLKLSSFIWGDLIGCSFFFETNITKHTNISQHFYDEVWSHYNSYNASFRAEFQVSNLTKLNLALIKFRKLTFRRRKVLNRSHFSFF